jgi:hypothetical protein
MLCPTVLELCKAPVPLCKAPAACITAGLRASRQADGVALTPMVGP